MARFTYLSQKRTNQQRIKVLRMTPIKIRILFSQTSQTKKNTNIFSFSHDINCLFLKQNKTTEKDKLRISNSDFKKQNRFFPAQKDKPKRGNKAERREDASYRNALNQK